MKKEEIKDETQHDVNNGTSLKDQVDEKVQVNEEEQVNDYDTYEMEQESQKNLDFTKLKKVVLNTLRGDFILYEDEYGTASDPINGLFLSPERDDELKKLGLSISVGDEKYLQPITLQLESGLIVPIPDEDQWYKWTVLMREDNLTFEFNRDEYYQALTVLLRYDELKKYPENNQV